MMVGKDISRAPALWAAYSSGSGPFSLPEDWLRDPGVDGLVVRELHVDLHRAGDDVRAGEDVAAAAARSMS